MSGKTPIHLPCDEGCCIVVVEEDICSCCVAVVVVVAVPTKDVDDWVFITADSLSSSFLTTTSITVTTIARVITTLKLPVRMAIVKVLWRLTVRDVTWMSDQSLHSAKWRAALEQVTFSHLCKCPDKLTT